MPHPEYWKVLLDRGLAHAQGLPRLRRYFQGPLFVCPSSFIISSLFQSSHLFSSCRLFTFVAMRLRFVLFVSLFDSVYCQSGGGCLSLKYRPIDGSCNNIDNPGWGRTGTTFARFIPPDYADSRGASRASLDGKILSGPRVVSLNLVTDSDDDDHPTASHMLMQWGQFINHDVTKKRSQSNPCCDDGQSPNVASPECMSIMVPPGDPFFGSKRCLSFTRSASTIVNGRREQFNDVTGYVDASPVYGSSESVTRSLRTFNRGTLRSGPHPFGKELLPTRPSDSSSIDSGDSRTNMIPSLVSVHVIILRLHNQIALDLADLNPHWDDETLFQESRRIVIALVQQITYRELLSSVLGEGNLNDLRLLDSGYFSGYNPSVNPSITNGFAVAAYRFGHSLVGSRLRRMTSNFQELPSPPLSSEFFNVSFISNPGQVDQIVIGLLNQRSQMSDSIFSNQIHHHLFSTDGTGTDLYAINVQRGRDHGLPGYVHWRQFCGFSVPQSFSELRGIIRPQSISAMERVYENVNDIDLYAGGMAEIPLQGGLVGSTFACLIGRQFSNLRRGDRFWYENDRQQSSFSPDQLREIRRVTLSRIICDAGDEIRGIQPQAMKVPGPSNPVVRCDTLPKMDLRPWSDRLNSISQNDINQQSNQQPNEPIREVVFEPPVPNRQQIPPPASLPQNRPISQIRPIQQNQPITRRPIQQSRPITRRPITQNRPLQQNRPIQQQSRPIQQQSRPIQQQNLPIQQQNRPIQQQNHPIQQQSRPIQQQNRPIQQQNRPIQQQNGPLQQFPQQLLPQSQSISSPPQRTQPNPSFQRPIRPPIPSSPRPLFFSPITSQCSFGADCSPRFSGPQNEPPTFIVSNRISSSHEQAVDNFLRGSSNFRPIHVPVGSESQLGGVSFRVPGSVNDVGPFGFVIRF